MKLLGENVGDASRHLTAKSQAGARRRLKVNASDADICGRFSIGNSIFIPTTLQHDCVITHADVAVLNANGIARI